MANFRTNIDFGFYNAINGDRKYNLDDITELFRGLLNGEGYIGNADIVYDEVDTPINNRGDYIREVFYKLWGSDLLFYKDNILTVIPNNTKLPYDNSGIEDPEPLIYINPPLASGSAQPTMSAYNKIGSRINRPIAFKNTLQFLGSGYSYEEYNGDPRWKVSTIAALPNGFESGSECNFIAIPKSSSELWIFGGNTGYKRYKIGSSNSSTWAEQTDGTFKISPNNCRIFYRSKNLYLFYFPNEFQTEIYESTNFGETWTRLNDPPYPIVGIDAIGLEGCMTNTGYASSSSNIYAICDTDRTYTKCQLYYFNGKTWKRKQNYFLSYSYDTGYDIPYKFDRSCVLLTCGSNNYLILGNTSDQPGKIVLQVGHSTQYKINYDQDGNYLSRELISLPDYPIRGDFGVTTNTSVGNFVYYNGRLHQFGFVSKNNMTEGRDAHYCGFFGPGIGASSEYNRYDIVVLDIDKSAKKSKLLYYKGTPFWKKEYSWRHLKDPTANPYYNCPIPILEESSIRKQYIIAYAYFDFRLEDYLEYYGDPNEGPSGGLTSKQYMGIIPYRYYLQIYDSTNWWVQKITEGVLSKHSNICNAYFYKTGDNLESNTLLIQAEGLDNWNPPPEEDDEDIYYEVIEEGHEDLNGF